MRDDEVPQKPGLTGNWHRMSYAVNREGRYVGVPCAGCDVVDTANAQAWKEVELRIEHARQSVIAGKTSPLSSPWVMIIPPISRVETPQEV